MKIFNPICPNLHTRNNCDLRVCCGIVKASVPSRWYNAWCSIMVFMFFSRGSGSKKCLFLSKDLDKIEEAFALNMIRIAKDCWNWKIEILHEGWKILLLLRFVPEISLPVCPNLHTPNNWHLSVYCYGGCGLVKAGDETLKTGKKHRVGRFLKLCCGSLRFLTLRTVPISELPHVRLPNCRAATAHAPWRSITSLN